MFPMAGILESRPGLYLAESAGCPLIIIEASNCNLYLPGSLTLACREFQLDFKLASTKQPFAPPFLACRVGTIRSQEPFALNEDTKANGKSDALLRTLRGKLEFIAIWGGMVLFINQLSSKVRFKMGHSYSTTVI
jgi:hypothetical protein